jgi:3-mercaptopyruvate sulfurtransferase SseA
MKNNTKQANSLLPMILIAAGVILVLTVIIWQIATTQPKAGSPAGGPTPGAEQVNRVSPQDAKIALDGKQAVILDVRSADSYAGGHIAGAINIPIAEIEARVGELKANQWIITYCT